MACRCGAPCSGQLCAQCELEDRLEREDPDAGTTRWEVEDE